MYEIKMSEDLEKTLEKIKNKDRSHAQKILKKMDEISENPSRYKNLKRPLQHLKRVHINKSFVLLFSVDEENNIVFFKQYCHHDQSYK